MSFDSHARVFPVRARSTLYTTNTAKSAVSGRKPEQSQYLLSKGWSTKLAAIAFAITLEIVSVHDGLV